MTFNLQTVTSDRIQDTLYAFMRSQILFTAIDLDLFSQIAAGYDTLPALMEHCHMHQMSERGLRILLNGLVGIGFLNKRENDTYALPRDVAHFLVRESESYMGGMVHHCKRLYENWSMLSDAVESGQSVGGAQSLNQLETYFAELVKGLYVSNYPTARRLADLLGVGEEYCDLNILDVAGGSAVWSIAMLEKDPASRATVIDFPSVIHVAEEFVKHHQLADRFTYWAGDLEEMTFPDAAFDIAVMANICHALGPVSTRRALNKLAKTLKPGGRLAIVDFVPDDRRSQAGWPLVFSVNMLITTPEGDVFTGTEYTQWLQAAGFQRVTLQEIENEVTAIVAEV
jgi:ubiquinone/menaquinone biosynthesis C-methylase UbiE